MGIYQSLPLPSAIGTLSPVALVSIVTMLSSATVSAAPSPALQASLAHQHGSATESATIAKPEPPLSERVSDNIAQLELAPADVLTLPGYTPAADSFQFSNQGITQFFNSQESQSAWLEQLTAALPTLFGSQVCLDGEVDPCVVTKAAQNWLSAQIELMAQGLCDGIAAANLMLWQTEARPAQTWWQTWLSALSPIPTIELPPSDPNLQEVIAQQTILQGVDEIYLPTQTLRENSTPNDILAELISTFREAPENPYSIGLYRRQGNQLVEGHTLLPYRIEPQGEGAYRVYVYDSNFPPGDEASTPYIAFNTRDNTWNYDPGEAAAGYRGDASTQNLDLTRLGWRYTGLESAEASQGLFTCPFCSATQAPQSLDIALIGEGNLGVYRLNPTTNEYVSVKPDSDLVPFKGGLDRQVPSRYSLTTDPSDPPLKVVIDAKAVPDQTGLTLQLIGSGYTAEFRPTWPQGDANSLTLYLAARANGPELTFIADENTVIPTLGIYLEDEITTPPPDVSPPEILEDNITQAVTTQYRKNVSYSMEIGGISLPAGHAVALSVDRSQQRFYFADNSPSLSRYNLNIQSRTKEQQTTLTDIREEFPNGTATVQTLTQRRTFRFQEAMQVKGVELEPQTLAYFDYGDWAQVPTEANAFELSEEVEIPIVYSPAEFLGPTAAPLALVPQTTTAETRVYRGNLIKSNYR
jgi:hypothetical protein